MDLVLTNARVLTSDDSQSRADTLAVRGGLLTFVGRAADLPREDGVSPVFDLGGRTVLPGLIDAHTHPARVARSQWHTRLPWTHDLDELLTFIREFGAAHPKEELPYLYFEYYPSTLFTQSPPTRELLDSAIGDRPVLCQDFSEHAHWVNSKMLELMGVTKDTPDPVPSLRMFVRDERGEPTGHILESAHEEFLETMYEALDWRPPERITAESLRPFLRFLTGHGVTSLFEAWTDDEDVLRALTSLEADGELPLRYEGAPRFHTLADLPERIATVREFQHKYGSARIRVRTLKLFLDGTNETGNSALLDPCVGAAAGQGHGVLQMECEELTRCLLLCNSSDVDLHIHMVGDRAFRTACDAVEDARSRAARGGAEWQTQVTFAHCELVDPQDMARPARLGIAVNWTPHWSGGYFGEEAKRHLGQGRWERMYEFNRIADAGAAVTFGSDVVTAYEHHRANPFFGMRVASSRVDPEFPLPPDTHPGSVRPNAASKLSLERLLKGYTIDAARQLRIDHRAGSLAVGKSADFVVLDEDPFALTPELLGEVRPVAVVFEGEVVAGRL